MLINRANIADMFRGFNLSFQGAWTQAQSMADQVAMTIPSTGSEEHLAWLGAMPRMREWIGDRVINSLKTHDYTIKNKTFEVSIGVKREHMEDDKIGIYTPIVQQMGFDAKTHPDELVFQQLILNAFGLKCYDGQNFFDTSHPVVAADGSVGTISNSGGGSGAAWYLLDLSRPIKPFVFQKRRDYAFTAMTEMSDEAVFMRGEFRMGTDARVNTGFGLWQLAYGSKQAFDINSYSAARAQMRSVKGDGGKVLAINPTHVLCGPSLEKTVLDVLNADRLASGASNTMAGTAKPIVCPWLA